MSQQIISLSIEQVFQDLDTNEDGKISYAEFKVFSEKDSTIIKFLDTMHDSIPLANKSLGAASQNESKAGTSSKEKRTALNKNVGGVKERKKSSLSVPNHDAPPSYRERSESVAEEDEKPKVSSGKRGKIVGTTNMSGVVANSTVKR